MKSTDREPVNNGKQLMLLHESLVHACMHACMHARQSVRAHGIEFSCIFMSKKDDMAAMRCGRWDDDDKLEELTEHGGAARFLIVREAHEQVHMNAFVIVYMCAQALE